jgi:tetratricopeptide (TPR) repeat protein
MHYIIVITIVAFIVIIQLSNFCSTARKIKKFKTIFPKKSNYKLQKEFPKEALIKQINSASDERLQQMLENANLCTTEYIKTNSDTREETENATLRRKHAREKLIAALDNPGISVSHNNDTFKTIVESINDYLKNNKSVSDFHLMKDIVDRNCDAKEEEINTQIPIPLYMGLVGTMAGILVGILYLWLRGGISDLLSTGGGSGADGVEALLGGVALAMISSILGIILTTWGSNKFKTAKLQVESDKHGFLSWIQAKLLPTLSDNVVGAIREMTENLNNFNEKFSKNTGNLGTALEKVNESYKMQMQLLDSVRKISDKDLTKQNLQLYVALQNSTKQIGILAQYLKDCNQYLTNVQALNKKLDDYENRIQFIETASKFYSKHEHWLSENYDEANRALKEVVEKYNKTIEEIFNRIKTDMEDKRQELGTFIDAQNKALVASAGNLDRIVKALSELGEVQKAVIAFDSSIREQNKKIDRLVEHIENLVNTRSSGGNTVQMKQETPIWQIIGISIIALSCLILAVKSFIKDEPKMEKIEVVPQSQSTVVPIQTNDSAAIDTSIVIYKPQSQTATKMLSITDNLSKK